MCNILHTLSKPAAERNQSRAVAQIKDGGCAWRAFLDVGQGFRSWGLSRPWGCHSGPSQRFEERGQRRPRAFKFRLERRQVTSVPTESQLPAVASRPGSSRRNLQPSTRGPRRPAHVDPARTARYTRLVSGSGLVRRPRPSPGAGTALSEHGVPSSLPGVEADQAAVCRFVSWLHGEESERDLYRRLDLAPARPGDDRAPPQ
jgi:hypothetical protein